MMSEKSKANSKNKNKNLTKSDSIEWLITTAERWENMVKMCVNVKTRFAASLYDMAI